MSDDPKRDDKRNDMRAAGMYAMIPALLLASPVVGFVLGTLLCKWTGAGDWLKAVMAMLGMAAGGNEVARIIKRASSGR